VNTITSAKGSETAINRAIAERILEESSIKFTQLIAVVQSLTTTLASNMAAVEKNLSDVEGTLKLNLVGIRQELIGGLSSVQSELAGGLDALPAKLDELNNNILAQFSRYGDPVKAAAEQIDSSYAGILLAIQDLKAISSPNDKA
jgi:hypothetical protein